MIALHRELTATHMTNGSDDKDSPKAVDISELGLTEKTSEHASRPKRGSATEQLERATERAAKFMEQARPGMRAYEAAMKTHGNALKSVGMESNAQLDALRQQIDGQFSAIDALNKSAKHVSAAPPMPSLNIPPNPALETNRRLARIAGQFEEMQGIAAKGAEIATQLQEYAASFLQKFEVAAGQTSRSAKTAITISITAIVLTVLLTAIQIAYTEFLRAPRDDAATRASIEALSARLDSLGASQERAAQLISDALADDRVTSESLLREIRDALASSPTSSVEQ